MTSVPFFHRTGASSYTPTEHVSGAWTTHEQHISPALGLLAHVAERDHAQRRDDRLIMTRLSYDIWGTVAMDEVTTEVRVLRPGRTIELVEATLTQAGRTAATLRAWLMAQGDTAAFEGSDAVRVAGPDETPEWDPTTVWPGGFIAAAQVRRQQAAPGRAVVWARTDVPLLDDEPVSPLAKAAGMFDIANGMTVRADPRAVAFPNVDLTAHVLRVPVGDWIGFDSTVSFGDNGVGLTSSVLHDARGPLGTLAQTLTVRPSR